MINIIVACQKDGGIGFLGTIPWREPEDLKYFKKITLGHNIVMGRVTRDSIGKDLPGRTNYVISKNNYPDLDSVLKIVGDEETFIIGGAQIYHLALTQYLHLINKIYVTYVGSNYQCDRFFPLEIVTNNFKEISKDTSHNLEFVVYQKNDI